MCTSVGRHETTRNLYFLMLLSLTVTEARAGLSTYFDNLDTDKAIRDVLTEGHAEEMIARVDLQQGGGEGHGTTHE